MEGTLVEVYNISAIRLLLHDRAHKALLLIQDLSLSFACSYRVLGHLVYDSMLFVQRRQGRSGAGDTQFFVNLIAPLLYAQVFPLQQQHLAGQVSSVLIEFLVPPVGVLGPGKSASIPLVLLDELVHRHLLDLHVLRHLPWARQSDHGSDAAVHLLKYAQLLRPV